MIKKKLKFFGTQNVFGPKIFRSKSRKNGCKKNWLKNIWVKEVLSNKNVGPQTLRHPTNWVPKVWSKSGQ